MAKAPAKKEKDVDYTVAGLLAIVAIVLFTAMFFKGGVPQAASTGQAWSGDAVETVGDPDAPDECEAMSYCDGTRLVRRHTDCNEYVGFCQFGCEELPEGGAQCR